MNLIERIKSLPTSAQRILGLGMVFALLVALPLFIWAIVTQRFEIRERAQILPSGVPSPSPITNSVNWTTPQAFFQADGFYIIANGKQYLGNTADMQIHSDPGSPFYTTLEMTWHENGDEMRMFIYFHSDGMRWWASEIRTYNGQDPADWIIYTADNYFFNYNLGYMYEQNTPGGFVKVDPATGEPTSGIYFSNLRVQAFSASTPPPTAEPTSADLEIVNITLEKIFPPTLPCISYRYNITVKNVGSQSAPKTRLKVFLNPPQTQTVNGCDFVESYTGADAPIPQSSQDNYLDPGESDTYYDYFNPSEANLVTIIAFADFYGQINEPNENNNVFSKNFEVEKLFPSPTPTPPSTATTSPTLTPEATFTPGEANSCGGTCGSNYNCKANLYCYQGFCRNPDCRTSKDCSCATPTAKPKTTLKPGATATPTNEIVYLSPRPSVTPRATFTPIPTETPELVATEQKKPDLKFLLYIGGGSFLLALILLGINSASKKP